MRFVARAVQVLRATSSLVFSVRAVQVLRAPSSLVFSVRAAQVLRATSSHLQEKSRLALTPGDCWHNIC